MPDPFILLDDARTQGAADARLYRHPCEIVTAHSAQEVLPALRRIELSARAGMHAAGYITYEAGLALEPRLAPLLESRTGANAPLLWFGLFDRCERIGAAEVPSWLDAQAGAGLPAIGPMEPRTGITAYEAAYAAIHDAITAGDIYQANLTFPLAGPWQGDPVALYAAIRPSAAAGYGAIIHDGSEWHLSFSPELFFSLKNGAVRVMPMKGTRPRGLSPDEDERLRGELQRSVKDRAENLMILDLMRNDLSRVSEAGSVRVSDPFRVETYPTVHQMVSSVNAVLAPGKGAVDLLGALFPCGSITGAPKIRAMELIDQVESGPRGLYCGSIGYIEPSGDAVFNVAIRTLHLVPGRNGDGNGSAGQATLGVGSAIVADSEALPEWRECLIKGGFVRELNTRPTGAVPSPASFDLIETMRFTPEEGVALLELHLERIKNSAADLGFNFDRHAVRNAIQALCFDADKPSRLRLVVARSGAYALELGALPPLLPQPATVAAMRMPVDSGDWRLRHKTSDRGFYDAGLAAATAAGAHEALFLRDDGLVTEGCFTNLFVERDGTLLTPAADSGLLPGVLRRSLIESGRAAEAALTLDDLTDGFLIGNALRGLMPARLLTSAP